MLKLTNLFNFNIVITPMHVAPNMDRHFDVDRNSKYKARRNPVLSL